MSAMKRAIALALAILSTGSWADEADDLALALPSAEPKATQGRRPWQLFTELGAGRSIARDLPSLAKVPRSTQRLSIDLQIDARLTPELRFQLADRFDADWQYQFERRHDVNTLKEAYVSWQPRASLVVDAGRVNQFSGVALGYNPTDYFRTGAVRSLVSVDPTSVKKNRQGSVMLRAQTFLDDSSFTVAYAPALSDRPSTDAFNLDFGATNARHRGLLTFSKRLTEDINPQWLMFLDEGQAPQFGMNLTRLVNDSTVGYLEWSGGRSRSLLEQALGQPAEKHFRNRVSTGLTYTTSNKLSLTLEYQYNGTGSRRGEWQALPAASIPAYAIYRGVASFAQEMPTRQALFAYAIWQDVLIKHLDLTVMVRRNAEDRSRLSWVEVRYKSTRDEVAWQWQSNSGSLLSEFGAAPVVRGWQVVYRHFF